MTRYRYRAVDADGRPYEDEVEGESSYAVTQSLQRQGLTVSSVEAVAPKGVLFPSLQRLKWEDLRLFTEQLEAILRSGYPLVPALAAMATELHHPALRAATRQLGADLEHGHSMEEAFRAQEHRFPAIFGALIRAGEATGNLAGVLAMMTQHASRMSAVKHRLKTAMAYPALLTVTALGVFLYMLLYIVPQFGSVFGEMGGVLPAPTRILLYISNILVYSWPVLFAGLPVLLVCAVAAYMVMRKSAIGRRFLDGIMLYCPGVGVAYQGVVQARFCRTLAILIEARVPMVDVLTLAGAASGSAILENGIRPAVACIEQGGKLVEALRRTGFFGPSFYWHVGTAEERDQVEEALESLAESAERTVTAREQVLGTIVAPLITAIIGIGVGFVTVSLYLPVFSLGDQINGG